MKNRPSWLECWSASRMLRPASARKPLTAAISPGRSGQASSRRVVGVSSMRASSSFSMVREGRLSAADAQDAVH
jgi:hypothetical protein